MQHRDELAQQLRELGCEVLIAANVQERCTHIIICKQVVMLIIFSGFSLYASSDITKWGIGESMLVE